MSRKRKKTIPINLKPQPKKLSSLTIDQAIANIDMVCANFSGTRQEHTALVQSVNTIKAAVK